jgi:2-amino-4-hydroxy-6-hydroxymethyldihydropteridine pyrophosphokinase
MERPITAYISLGGNQGNEAERFAQALETITNWQGIHVSAVSRLYRTEPQGDADQPWFSNQVVSLDCSPEITPDGLLASMLCLEQQLGRNRDPGHRFGPRAIDLDLLLFGNLVRKEEGLCLPHPRMRERAFVLVPLFEIAPSLRFPDGEAVVDCLKKIQYSAMGSDIFQKMA